MAPLPPNSTARFKVFYTNIAQQHVMDIRSADSPVAFGLNVDDLLNALSGMLLATVIDEVQFAASGSNVFNAVTTGIEGLTYGTGAGTPNLRAAYVNFVGRSSGGRRVRLAVFGVNNVTDDYRFISGESAFIDNALLALNATANHFICIDGLAPIWKNYANSGFNAYWQRAVRP